MDVAAGRPWWQLTKTARQGFMVGALQAVLGLVQLLAALHSRSHAWILVVTGVIPLVLAVGYLASAAALVRRERCERSGTASGTPGQPGLPLF